jgi:hypothetical protein
MAPWAIGGIIFLLPVAGVFLSDEMAWDETDFVVFGAMLLVACGTYEVAMRSTGNIAYRAAVGIAVVAAFILVWINLAVGIIGSEDNPANLMFGGVLAIGIIGALLVRSRPLGMARTLIAMAAGQALAGGVALIAGWGSTGANWPRPIIVLTAVFTAAWLLSAWLFRRAGRQHSSAGVAGSSNL